MLSVASATSPFHWSFTFTILGHPCTLPWGIFVGNPLQRPGFQLFQSSTNWQSGPVDYLIVRIPEPIGSQAFKRLNLLSEHSKSVIFWCSHSGIGSAPRFNRLKFPNSNPTQKPWFSGESFWFYGLQGEGIWNDLSALSQSAVLLLHLDPPCSLRLVSSGKHAHKATPSWRIWPAVSVGWLAQWEIFGRLCH